MHARLPKSGQFSPTGSGAPARPIVQRAALHPDRVAAQIQPGRESIADYARSHASGTARAAATPNRTGLPDRLKTGIETLSGLSLDDVRVHRNSGRPAQLQALAHSQGSEIHLGPGQERQLAHEAWHVVQQKQGRVQATTRLGGTAINDDAGLEREADTMGARAASHAPSRDVAAVPLATGLPARGEVAQCAGHIRFANLSTDPVFAAKGQSIIDGLLATPSIAAFLQTRDALITLEPDPQLASVRTTERQVQISLSPWFFEQESRGRILGMLAHEFGVHPLATQAMSLPERTQENLDNTQNTAFATNIPNTVNHTITPQQAGQRDHVFAAVAGQPRFREYRRTVLQMAGALVQRAQGQNAGGVTEAHVTDLIMTYLSDLAMILATNDHRLQIVTNSGRTADAFNHVRAGWLASLNVHNAVEAELIRLTPAQKTGGDVLNEVRSVVGSRSLAFFRFWRGPTDDRLYAHAQAGGGGGVAATSQVQAQVLADDGLQLAPAAQATPGLIDALVATGMDPLARANALQVLTALQNPNADQQRAIAILGQRENLRTELSWGVVNALGRGLQRTLRILEPSGKMLESNNHGALLTLVRILRPTARYRVAQPIPVVVQAPPVVQAPVQLPVLAPVVAAQQGNGGGNRPRARSVDGQRGGARNQQRRPSF